MNETRLVTVLSEHDIRTIVHDLAQRISSDYQGRDVVMIGILKGAFIFLADVVRHLTIPVLIDFVRISSYGESTTSGDIHFSKPLELDVTGKDIVIVEDIVDTGQTLQYLADYLKTSGAESVRICTLIDKLERRKTDIHIDYSGRTVEKGFLVGYGLDCAEQYRHLPEVFEIIL